MTKSNKYISFQSQHGIKRQNGWCSDLYLVEYRKIKLLNYTLKIPKMQVVCFCFILNMLPQNSKQLK